jgi:hypothetical protein
MRSHHVQAEIASGKAEKPFKGDRLIARRRRENHALLPTRVSSRHRPGNIEQALPTFLPARRVLA